MVTYVLSKPVNHDGETITEISMDLEGLSSDDLEKCERIARTMLKKKESMAVPETNKKYQATVAAKAAGLPLHVIRSLSGKDYTGVCLEVMNFLLDGDSEETEANTEEFFTGQKKVEPGAAPILTMAQMTEEAPPHTLMESPEGYASSVGQ